MSKINFEISNYTISDNENSKKIIIEGQKLPPPSKRITLHQKNIKILSAKIIHKHKKGDIEFEVVRINHIKSFNEIRIHTNSILYPGTYILTLSYTGQIDEEQLDSNQLP